MKFASISEVLEKVSALSQADEDTVAQVRDHQLQLTKPPGSLGRLEELVEFLAGWQRRAVPRLDRVQALVFAGNHGICAQGVNPYPQGVTAQMVANFERGGAAINQLCAVYDAKLSVIGLDLDQPTNDFTSAVALPESECLAAVNAGALSVDPQADLLILGEMGIGNSTVAAALACALLGGPASDWVGAGTGADSAGMDRKVKAVKNGLALHQHDLDDPLRILMAFGGREQAAIVGAVLAARHYSIPVILDGFICCAAAAVVARLCPSGLDHCLVGHCSTEPGHERLLREFGKEPLLRLGMRLGEGSGAAMALGVIRGALACHNGMATFASAGVDSAEGTLT